MTCSNCYRICLRRPFPRSEMRGSRSLRILRASARSTSPRCHETPIDRLDSIGATRCRRCAVARLRGRPGRVARNRCDLRARPRRIESRRRDHRDHVAAPRQAQHARGPPARRSAQSAERGLRDALAGPAESVGLHRVSVREISGTRLLVGPIEAVDGTPVVDIKRPA